MSYKFRKGIKVGAAVVMPRRMNMPEIRKKAKSLGVSPGKMKKSDLIHALQIAESCTPCYGRSSGECAHTDCCFIGDCLKLML